MVVFKQYVALEASVVFNKKSVTRLNLLKHHVTQGILDYLNFNYFFGVLYRFQHCTGHITAVGWKGKGNQYIQFIRVLYCKLPTNSKQLPAFPLEAVPGTEPQPQRLNHLKSANICQVATQHTFDICHINSRVPRNGNSTHNLNYIDTSMCIEFLASQVT